MNNGIIGDEGLSVKMTEWSSLDELHFTAEQTFQQIATAKALLPRLHLNVDGMVTNKENLLEDLTVA